MRNLNHSVNVGAGAGLGSQSQAHIGTGPSPVNAGAGARLSSQDGVPQQPGDCSSHYPAAQPPL